jgi:hypothetical protein
LHWELSLTSKCSTAPCIFCLRNVLTRKAH